MLAENILIKIKFVSCGVTFYIFFESALNTNLVK